MLWKRGVVCRAYRERGPFASIRIENDDEQPVTHSPTIYTGQFYPTLDIRNGVEGEGETGEGKTPLKDTCVFSMHGHASRFNAATLDKAHSRRCGEAGKWSLCSFGTPRAS